MQPMFGAASITDETVRAAVRGDACERNKVLEALTSQVRAMITIRLSPTPAQFHAVDDLVQQSLIALSAGLDTLRDARLAALRSFASVVVGRKVADFLRKSNVRHRKSHGVIDFIGTMGSVGGNLYGQVKLPEGKNQMSCTSSD